MPKFRIQGDIESVSKCNSICMAKSEKLPSFHKLFYVVKDFFFPFLFSGIFVLMEYNVFRHVETLFVQDNQVRTESKQTSFLLPKEEVCFDSVRTCLPWTNKVSTCRNALLFAPYPKPKVENYSGAN